jgi:signal transduction histidine kinase
VPDISTNSTTPEPGGADNVPPAERLVLDILDTVRQPLLVLDPEFRVTHANRSFLTTFRVSADQTIGQVLFLLGDRQWDIAPLREMLRSKLEVVTQLNDFDVDHVFPVIGHRIMLLNARLVSRGPGVPRIILLAIEDVTDRRLAERRMVEYQQELRRSNEALDEFAAVASHDLQEPLRKIVSFGERLGTVVGPTLEGNARQYLERMLDAAVRMRTLINGLLAYSRVTTRLHPFVPTDLAVVAQEVIADLEITVADSGGRVEVGQLPVIEADALQMRQLLQNLIGNALKYRRKETPPLIRIQSTQLTGSCVITVADNGIGFSPEHADKIFRMFERLHGRKEYEGSGIGLAICRRIAERHHGTIGATSTPGSGATFTVTLPVTQAALRHMS